MAAEKMSISMDGALSFDIRAAARDAGVTVSAWLAKAAEAQLRAAALRSFLDDWQAEHGAFTEAEIQKAEIELGLRRADSGSA